MALELVPLTHRYARRKHSELVADAKALKAKALEQTVAIGGLSFASVGLVVGLIAALVAGVFVVAVLAAFAATVAGAFAYLKWPVLVVLRRDVARREAEAANFAKGMQGEERAAEKLRQLPDAFVLIHDYNLGSGRGNADHIVCGPGGIVVVETKFFSGRFRIKNDRWTKVYDGHNGREAKAYRIDGGPSVQALRNAERVGEVLAAAGLRVAVTPLVVLANPEMIVEHVSGEVPVLGVDRLGEALDADGSKHDFFILGRAAQALYERAR